MIFLRSVLVPSLLLVPLAALGQGETGFLRGAGHTDVSVTYSLNTYDRFWIGSREVEDAAVGRIDRRTVSVYVAYGLTDAIDLVGNFAWARSESNGSGGFATEDDPQDATLSVKWRLFEQRVGEGALSLLAAPGIKIPLTDYEENAVTAIGDEQIDLRFRAIVHYQLDRGAFVSVEGGYDRRLEAPSDELVLNVTAGVTIERVTATIFYSGTDSLGGYDIGEGRFPGVEEDLERLGLGAYVRLTDGIGVAANIWTTTDGQNTGIVDGFSLGFVFRS